jgi:DNA-binding transcriptional ArsR family regulator
MQLMRGMAEMEARAEEVSALLTLMANPKRLLILCRLAEGERSVGALAAAVGLSQSALSQHLARLREAGVVATRREGQSIFYRLADERVRAVMDALYAVFCGGGAAALSTGAEGPASAGGPGVGG